MNKSTFLKALLIGVAFIFGNEMKAQTIKTDTIRESRLDNLATILGGTSDDIIADDAALKQENWFVSFGAGINAIAAEGNDKVNNFIDRRRARIQVTAGYWFNRYFGLRGQAGIGKVSAYYLAGPLFNQNPGVNAENSAQYLINKNGSTFFRRKFTYVDLSFAAMTDVVKWFESGKDSKWGVQLYAGPTFTYSFKKQNMHNNCTWGAKVGTQIDYKITKRLSIMADLQANFLNESFDGVEGGELGGDYKKLDFLGAATIGFSYFFGGAPAKADVEIPVVYQDIYNPQSKVIKEVKAPAKEIIAPFAVRFLIDKSYIEKSQKPQIDKIAEYLKNNEDARIMLTGYADKETAYPEYNMRLSQRRVDSVKKYLINECGIDEERISTSAKGDTERAYDEDFRWNRVVLMSIIEK